MSTSGFYVHAHRKDTRLYVCTYGTHIDREGEGEGPQRTQPLPQDSPEHSGVLAPTPQHQEGMVSASGSSLSRLLPQKLSNLLSRGLNPSKCVCIMQGMCVLWPRGT